MGNQVTPPPRRNWSENVTYLSPQMEFPTDLDALRHLVATHERVKALGSRHSFNDSADTSGLQVSLDLMPRTVRIDAESRSTTSSAGISHAELSAALYERGLAMPNLASLPHISVGGAIQTGTHGSGVRNAALSAAVTAIELVDANGDVRQVGVLDEDFAAVVVGLGAFGVVHSVTQDVVAAFEVEQRVFERVGWDPLLSVLEDVMSSAYSVSLFSRFDAEHVHQVWVKRRTTDPAPYDLTLLGGIESRIPLHPLPDTPAVNVTEQLGRPGPSHDRLPHFRSDFKPGRGDEIQSEYLVDAEVGVEAVCAVRELGSLLAPLLHMAEVRRVAADTAWLSPSGGRDSLAIHFTWRRLSREVQHVIPILEAVLLPLGARPHWGKAFACDHAALLRAYPRLNDFAALVATHDPHGTFENAFLRRVLGRA
jgi:xylitol oxidase